MIVTSVQMANISKKNYKDLGLKGGSKVQMMRVRTALKTRYIEMMSNS